jgi:hypothetical protein
VLVEVLSLGLIGGEESGCTVQLEHAATSLETGPQSCAQDYGAQSAGMPRIDKVHSRQQDNPKRLSIEARKLRVVGDVHER